MGFLGIDNFTMHDSNHYLIKDGWISGNFIYFYEMKEVGRFIKTKKPVSKGRPLTDIDTIEIIDHYQDKSQGWGVYNGALGAITLGVFTGGIGALLGGLAGYALTGNIDEVTLLLRFEDGKNALITVPHEVLQKIL